MLTALVATLALGISSCGTDEIAPVDAAFELEQRAQIDAAIADLEGLRADPGRAETASESIGTYLRSKGEARRFNQALGVEEEDGAPPASPLMTTDDQVLDPARKQAPGLFGPTGQAIAPEDLGRFRRAVGRDPAAVLRPVVADPVELLTTRARYGLDAAYPDQGGLTRREVIADAASALEPSWPGLAADLERILIGSG